MTPFKNQTFIDPVFLLVLLLAVGCALPPPPSTEEDRLRPPAGAEHQSGTAKTGQQLASLEITERGRQTLADGRVEQAVSLFEKAISLDPRNPYAYYYLGKSRFIRKEYDRILTPLEQARHYFLKERGWLSKVHALRGQAYEALTHWAEARAEFLKAIEMDGQNSEARDGLKRVRELF